jgi:uncharacterized damage-inducible protein DinB
MYRTLEGFFNKWNYESESTVKLFRRLTDASLEQRVTPEGRSLRDLGWHITGTMTQLLGQAGIAVDAPQFPDKATATAEDLAEAYKRTSDAMVDAIRATLTDEKLAETVQMFGETWSYGMVLQALIDHQIHHRGQMTVLMRQADLTVPGIYGPAREEWEAMGMAPMK